MLLDNYLDHFFPPRLQSLRIPSRLVRYGIIHTDTLRNTLNEFEPRFDPAMKAQAEKMVEKLQAFIALMEEYEENTIDGPTEEDDNKAASKARKRDEVSAEAKAKGKAKAKKS